LDVFHESRPGIILTDLKLGPEMDGVALCSKIMYEDNSVSVIAMSGYFSEYDKIYAKGAGFVDALTKPVSKKELDSALNCAYERRARWNAI